MEYLNIIISITNIVAIIPIIKSISLKKYNLAIFIFFTMMASFIYHMSEHIHGLPGCFLMEYSEVLLFIDRIFALFTILYGINQVINIYKNKLLDYKIFVMAGIAITFITLSELFGNNPYYWTFFHSIWHISAFLTLEIII